ncbi:hypothetical protein IWX85_001342 [Polaromonas sp. CG_9.11]|nr:hypothetical protein [Polaromonas sp. CG_9.11]
MSIKLTLIGQGNDLGGGFLVSRLLPAASRQSVTGIASFGGILSPAAKSA